MRHSVLLPDKAPVADFTTAIGNAGLCFCLRRVHGKDPITAFFKVTRMAFVGAALQRFGEPRILPRFRDGKGVLSGGLAKQSKPKRWQSSPFFPSAGR